MSFTVDLFRLLIISSYHCPSWCIHTMIMPESSLEVSLEYFSFHLRTRTGSWWPFSEWLVVRWIPLPLSIFSTFSSPLSPPRATQPSFSLQARHLHRSREARGGRDSPRRGTRSVGGLGTLGAPAGARAGPPRRANFRVKRGAARELR